MAHKRINITLPEELLLELDIAVAVEHAKRSQFIREAILLKLQLETAIESEVSDDDSMFRLVRHLHVLRMSKRRSNQTGPLTWNQVQD